MLLTDKSFSGHYLHEIKAVEQQLFKLDLRRQNVFGQN